MLHISTKKRELVQGRTFGITAAACGVGTAGSPSRFPSCDSIQ